MKTCVKIYHDSDEFSKKEPSMLKTFMLDISKIAVNTIMNQSTADSERRLLRNAKCPLCGELVDEVRFENQIRKIHPQKIAFQNI